MHSTPMPEHAVKVKGYDFSEGADFAKILGAMRYTGFQATSYGMAVDEINRMITWRYSDEPVLPEDDMQGVSLRSMRHNATWFWARFASHQNRCTP